MGESNIGWTDETWNPVTGCSRVSPGCEHCYAEALSLRYGWSKKPWTNQNAAENVVRHPSRLERPLSWRKPRMVFVNSMSDLFHPLLPFSFIDQVFAIMGLRNIHTNARHTYQVLTKRPGLMQQYMTDHFDVESVVKIAIDLAEQKWGPVICREEWKRRNGPYIRQDFAEVPLPKVWLGTSVEDQRRADERIPLLLDTPAAVRFLSVEPLLEWVSIYEYLRTGEIAWVIVGGESGPQHRPMEADWLRNIRDECSQANVPLFVKQDSGSRPGKQGRIPNDLWAHKAFPEIAA